MLQYILYVQRRPGPAAKQPDHSAPEAGGASVRPLATGRLSDVSGKFSESLCSCRFVYRKSFFWYFFGELGKPVFRRRRLRDFSARIL